MENVYLSRRRLLSASGALALAAAAQPGGLFAQAVGPGKSKRLRITIAGYRYDRVRALADLRVPIEGCDLSFEEDGVGKMNTHVFKGPQTRAVTEIGLSPFILAFCNDGFRDYELRLSGEVDAIFDPAEPQVFIDRHPKVDGLFRDHRRVEQAYFKKTGIFPIVHVVAIRRDVARAN